MHQFKDLVKVGFVSITQVPGPLEGRSKKNNSQKWSWEGYQQIGGVGKMQALVPLQKHQKKKKKAETVRTTFVRTPEISQRLTATK